MLGDPTFWSGVALIVFFALVGRRLWQGLAGSLDKRATRIKAELDEAQQLREAAQHLLADYQRKQRDAIKEAEAILTHAREEAERVRAKAAEDFETALARREQQAKDRIAHAEAEALAGVRAAAVDLAIAAAARILADKLDDKKGGALIDEAIRGLPEKLH